MNTSNDQVPINSSSLDPMDPGNMKSPMKGPKHQALQLFPCTVLPSMLLISETRVLSTESFRFRHTHRNLRPTAKPHLCGRRAKPPTLKTFPRLLRFFQTSLFSCADRVLLFHGEGDLDLQGSDPGIGIGHHARPALLPREACSNKEADRYDPVISEW